MAYEERELKTVKTTLCAAMALSCAASWGQASVNLYGVMDVGLRMDRTSGGTVRSVQSGMASATRWGLSGTEDLGGGLSAVFVMEAGFLGDSGIATANGAPGPGFGRQIYVGLSSKDWGALTLGRQYTPFYNAAVTQLDPFAFGALGGLQNTHTPLAPAGRASNSLKYVSPSLGGVTGQLIYALGETSTTGVSRQAGNQIGMNLVYRAPRYAAVYAMHQVRGTPEVSDLPKQTVQLVGGNYDFGTAKVYASYHHNTNNAATAATKIERRSYSLAVQVPVGPQDTVIAQYQVSDDKTAGRANTKVTGLGYNHALSKRTGIYVGYARRSNDSGANFTIMDALNSSIGTIARGSSASSFNVGLRHSF